MSGEIDPLSKLSASIADGEPIDWDAVCALVSNDDDIRRLIDHLRIVASVAEVHRSQVDEAVTQTVEIPQDLSSTAPDPQPPKRWGHLLLIRKIGEGAYGEVYEALDTWLDHPRALKLLKPATANRASAPQILHEARKLVRVRHPNVVMVHGADSHDGRVGFWMDLIEGQTLEQRVRDGRLSAGEAIYVGKELCRALAAVHQADLLHRDVKAQNVMRASDGGRIILMDFGAGEFRSAPSAGRPQGTPLYLAPELFTGAAATVQTDIYALGVLLYYLVTGRFPVEGKSFTDLALAHAQHARRHLRDARSDLPDAFVGVVERATDPDPSRRFHSAGDLHAALEERELPRRMPDPVVPAPVPSPPPVPSPQPPTLQQRLGYAFLAVVAVVVLIEVFGFVAARTFEAVFHVDQGFGTGPAEYFRIGREALLPFTFFWLAGTAFFAVLAGVRVVLRREVLAFRHTAHHAVRVGGADYPGCTDSGQRRGVLGRNHLARRIAFRGNIRPPWRDSGQCSGYFHPWAGVQGRTRPSLQPGGLSLFLSCLRRPPLVAAARASGGRRLGGPADEMGDCCPCPPRRRVRGCAAAHRLRSIRGGDVRKPVLVRYRFERRVVAPICDRQS